MLREPLQIALIERHDWLHLSHCCLQLEPLLSMYWVVIFITLRLSVIVFVESISTYVLAEGVSTSYMTRIVIMMHDHLGLIVTSEEFLRVSSAARLSIVFPQN